MTDYKAYNKQLIEEFRAKHGSLNGRQLLLLTTTGARSGKRHTAPMMFIRDSERLLVIASNIGAPVHPDWYANLVAHSQVTVEIGSEIYEANATTLEGTEREQVWARIIERYPFFAEHQAKTTRQIPVVVLERKDG